MPKFLNKSKMEQKFSRDSLRSIADTVEEVEIDKFIDRSVSMIKIQIIQKAYQDSPKKDRRRTAAISAVHYQPNQQTHKLKINLPIHPVNQDLNFEDRSLSQLFNPVNYGNINQYLPTIIEILKTIFPDVSFIVDPLQTYLLIDWSNEETSNKVSNSAQTVGIKL